MARSSHRDKLLTEGLRVVHEHGFAGASVRDIVKAAGVPQGSFTNHFTSKEAFGLEVIALYQEQARQMVAATLLNESLTPLARLTAYLDTTACSLKSDDMKRGCLFGNFSIETVDSSAIRQRLVDAFAELQRALATCLRAAVKAKEIPEDTDCDDVAGFIVASMQGATLLAKAQRSAAPVERFRRILFSTILHAPQAA